MVYPIFFYILTKKKFFVIIILENKGENMLVYRYEKPDGGGPWFYKDGTIRYPLPHEHLYIESQEKYLYGCDSFSKQHVDVNNCTIQTYDIPQKRIINMGQGQIKFLKKDIE